MTLLQRTAAILGISLAACWFNLETSALAQDTGVTGDVTMYAQQLYNGSDHYGTRYYVSNNTNTYVCVYVTPDISNNVSERWRRFFEQPNGLRYVMTAQVMPPPAAAG